MTSDFEMIVHHFDEDITIIPIADVHLGSRECREQEFISFIDSIKDKPNVYLILGGDLCDNGTRNAVTDIFKATIPPSAQRKMMAKILEPVRNKVLCGVSGNHERRSGKDADFDPMFSIMSKLDLEDRYREDIAFLKIQMGAQLSESGQRTHGYERPAYHIVVTHGHGGGQLTSGAVLRGERSAYAVDGADLFIFAHTHKPFLTQPGKIVIDPRNNKVSIKPFKVMCMTSWINYGGYAAQKMLLPSSHALQTITLSSKRKEMVVTM